MSDTSTAKTVKHSRERSQVATLAEILAANATLHDRYDIVTAVFTGATQGIGLGTLQAFVKRIPRPRAIIVGRSRERFEDEMKNLASLNAAVEFIFIEGELSLIKGVDAICEQIKQSLAGSEIDILFMSQGYAPLERRDYTAEGIDLLFALVYYGRMRMVQNLIHAAVMQPTGTIVSILAGTCEGKIYEDDLDLKRNYSLLKTKAQFASLTTLTLDTFAAKHPEMACLHIFPGNVKTGFMSRSVNSTLLKLLLGYVLEPILALGGISTSECGERMLWMALSERHAKPSTGKTASLDYDGTESQSEELTQYRQNGPLLAQIQAHHQQVFKKALAL